MPSPAFSRRFGPVLCALGLLVFAPFSPLPAQLAPPPTVNPDTQDDLVPVVTPSSVSAVAGQPFMFQVRATNSPTSYSVLDGLPDGLALDLQTGVISGTPSLANFYTVTIQASNDLGTSTAKLQLAVYLKPVPTVTIAFEKNATISDGKPTAGSFLLTRTGGDSADLVVVNLKVTGGAARGVDYNTFKNPTTVKGKKGSKHLSITPRVHEGAGPGKKTIKVTLQPGIGYILGERTTAKLKIVTAE